MRIVADQNITEVEAAFSRLGEVTRVPGRSLAREQLQAADMLLVRSVTRVNAELLEGTPVRFVATATSGVDHVDVDYLRARSIEFADAPGSNAESVAEYVISAVLLRLAAEERRVEDITVGIIGCGQVGSRVAQKCEALGMGCVLNDPPLREATGDPRYVDIEAALDADVVTLHVPLTDGGRYPTRHLLDATRLQRLRPDALLINTARGGVVDESALLLHLYARSGTQAVIDCWENEPGISRKLLARAVLATAHVAGYSYDGKLRATEMIYQAACRFVGAAPAWKPDIDPVAGGYMVDTHVDQEALKRAVIACYDVRADDALLRFALTMGPKHLAPYFDGLRRDYRKRREFPALKVTCHRRRDKLAAMLAGLGFTVRLVP
jgi:erythronate-4-phosphate dehydrogenase